MGPYSQHFSFFTPYNLECLVLAGFFSLVLMLANRAGAYPMCSTLGSAPALIATLEKAGKACQEQAHQSIGAIHKFRRKYSVVNAYPDLEKKIA